MCLRTQCLDCVFFCTFHARSSTRSSEPKLFEQLSVTGCPMFYFWYEVCDNPRARYGFKYPTTACLFSIQEHHHANDKIRLVDTVTVRLYHTIFGSPASAKSVMQQRFAYVASAFCGISERGEVCRPHSMLWNIDMHTVQSIIGTCVPDMAAILGLTTRESKLPYQPGWETLSIHCQFDQTVSALAPLIWTSTVVTHDDVWWYRAQISNATVWKELLLATYPTVRCVGSRPRTCGCSFVWWWGARTLRHSYNSSLDSAWQDEQRFT